ncbi:MAG: hypothetical protein D6722_09720 [Bacteroidetes bacterium]|nr:MAG: hypothetical protein D6722_09720 [Bacteroidota bacterium]
MDALAQEEEEAFLRWVAEYEARFRGGDPEGPKLQHELALGFPVEEILQACHRHKPDMLVMGTTGASNVLEHVFGSTTSAVMEQADCPVLAVPAAAAFSQIRRVAYASDLKERDRRHLYQLDHLAHMLGAEILQVHITSEDIPEGELSWMEDLYGSGLGFDHVPFHVIGGKDVAQSLSRFAEAKGIDLLAVMPHRRTFWQHLFHKSLAREMVLHARKPILAVKS